MATINIKGYEVLIDDEDIERVMRLSWWVLNPKRKSTYFSHTGPRPEQKNILLHRFILGVDDHRLVDHKNMNTLDCRKSNLRICNKAQNSFNRGLQSNNTSGFKGVTFDKARGLWAARININGWGKHLGRFKDKEDAYEAYCKVAKELHGEFARL